MGYSHTWGYLPDDPGFAAVFPSIRENAAVILNELAPAVRIAGPLGDGKPHFSNSEIAFNGAEPDAAETFLLSTNPIPRQRLQADSGRWFSWAFCKTNRLPYDIAVMAVLLRAHQLAPSLLTLGIAGSWDREWRPARDLLEGLFGTVTASCPLRDASGGPAAVRAIAQHP